MKKLVSYCVLLIAMFISCSKPNPADQAGIEKEKAADTILRKVSTRMKLQANLRPCGTMGQMLGKVEVLGLSFCYYKQIDIAEGRKLLIQAVNAMLEEVNQDEKIRPYLCWHPFEPNNVQMDIFLRKEDGRDVPRGALCVIDASEGFLQYQIHHPDTNRLTTIYKETFQEALERLEDPSLPLVPYKPTANNDLEETTKLLKGISFVDSDGVIFHLNEQGNWTKDPLPNEKKLP